MFVSDGQPSRPLPVFDDDFVTIYPLQLNDKLLACPWYEHGMHDSGGIEVQQNNFADAKSKSKYNSFVNTISSSSYEKMDSPTSSDSEGSKSLESPRDKRNLKRHLTQEDNHPKISEAANKDAITYEGKRILAEEKLKMRGFGSSSSEQCSYPNGKKRKKDGSRDLLASNVVIHEGREECLHTSSTIERVHEQIDCQWRVNNKLERELPNLPDGAIPVYIKSPSGTVTVIDEKIIKQNQLASDSGQDDQTALKAGELIGFVCYMKKLRSAYIVVNCETLELADELHRHSLLSCFSCCNTDKNGGGSCSYPISTVIHLSPPSVLRSEKYISWMRHLGDGILHITMQDGPSEYGFLNSFTTLAKMNMVNKEIFPLPFNASLQKHQKDDENINFFGFSRQVKTGQMLMCVVFQRNLESEVQVVVDDSMCQEKMNVELIQKTLSQSRTDLTEKINKVAEDVLLSSQNASMQMSANKLSAIALREKLLRQRKLESNDSTTQGVCVASSNISSANNLNCEGLGKIRNSLCNGRVQSSQFKLLFLGTGSAEPSKYRGSSGILLQMHNSGASMLLDAGEGVAGQILRAFGKHKMEMVVNGLQCVWISHKHADHVLGIVSIIATRSEGGPDLLVVGSTAVHKWLVEVNHVYRKLGYSFPPFTFVHCKEFMGHQKGSNICTRPGYENPVSRMLEILQLHSMHCVWVDHCFEAFGLVLSSMSGWSVVYSGDTRPCENLIKAGTGCTLLIHEATFEDKFESHARAKRHSTISEAIEVGQQMGARHVILTHFSNRSPKVMGIDISKNGGVSLAYDGMVACSSHFLALPGLTQCLAGLFAEDNSNIAHQCSNTNLNQSKQSLATSSRGRSKLREVVWDPSDNERTDETSGHSSNAIPSMKSLDSEQCCHSKHISWNNSESEDDCLGDTGKAIPSTKALYSKQGCLPKHIRWNESETEDDV